MSQNALEKKHYSQAEPIGTHPWILYFMWGLVFIGSFIPAAPWASQYGLLFTLAGIGMLIAPSFHRIPKSLLALAFLFLLLGASSFLPAAWFPTPEWRGKLTSLGVATGSQVVIQQKHALEHYGFFAMATLSGLWMIGHRPSSLQLRNLGLLFSGGVAVYSIAAIILHEILPVNKITSGHFGFFPNRNHTGTYLAAGILIGLGAAIQGIRDRQFWRTGLAGIFTAISATAILGWSISRGGVLALGIGLIFWIPFLGRNYLGRHGKPALIFMILLIVGAFFAAETTVGTRMTQTKEKVEVALNQQQAAGDLLLSEGLEENAWTDVDFRVPTMLDTLEMIKSIPLTGAGAGQYQFIFPQYRQLTAKLNGNVNVHPESDWLWMAAELGIPATACLLIAVISTFVLASRSIWNGRDRALRSALLAGAAIIAIHGIFDVPGHRLAILWTGTLFLGLALPLSGKARRPMIRGASYLSASIVLIAGLRLSYISYIEAPWFPLTTDVNFYEKALTAYQNSQNSQKDSLQRFREIARAQKLTQQAIAITPLDRKLRQLDGLCDIRMTRYDEADRQFFIERTLAPTWVELPLNQGFAWIQYSPERATNAWIEAFERADWMDRHHPQSLFGRKRTQQKIIAKIKGNIATQSIINESLKQKR